MNSGRVRGTISIIKELTSNHDSFLGRSPVHILSNLLLYFLLIIVISDRTKFITILIHNHPHGFGGKAWFKLLELMLCPRLILSKNLRCIRICRDIPPINHFPIKFNGVENLFPGYIFLPLPF